MFYERRISGLVCKFYGVWLRVRPEITSFPHFTNTSPLHRLSSTAVFVFSWQVDRLIGLLSKFEACELFKDTFIAFVCSFYTNWTHWCHGWMITFSLSFILIDLILCVKKMITSSLKYQHSTKWVTTCSDKHFGYFSFCSPKENCSLQEYHMLDDKLVFKHEMQGQGSSGHFVLKV